MASLLTIGDLARAVGVPISTVRYYERAGLVNPDQRSAANYRLYADRTAERLRFIRTAQSAGFTLADIKILLELRDGDTAPCGEVRAVVEERFEHITERIDELEEVRRVLGAYLDMCRQAKADDPCEVMERLDA